MRGILKRLFVKLPFFILSILSFVTLIIPFFYWLITGKNYLYLLDDINNWIDFG